MMQTNQTILAGFGSYSNSRAPLTCKAYKGVWGLGCRVSEI